MRVLTKNWILIPVSIVGFFGTYAIIQKMLPSVDESFLIEAILAVFAIVVVVASNYGSILSAKQAEDQQTLARQKLAEAENRPVGSGGSASPPDFWESVQRAIEIAGKQANVSAAEADGRARNLFSRGTTILSASILGPVLAVILYVSLDPLAESTVSRLEDLKQTLGALPQGIHVSAERDWRILAAGVTFGLLMLATARGLLTQQSKEAQRHSHFSERVGYFLRLGEAAALLNKGAFQHYDADVVDFVNERLLSGGHVQPPAGGDDEPGPENLVLAELKKNNEFLKGISDAMRKGGSQGGS